MGAVEAIRRPGIGLAAATWLELGLGALRDGDKVRAVGAFASIGDTEWHAILDRFPHLGDLIQTWEAKR
jgi:hypothetical protein